MSGSLAISSATALISAHSRAFSRMMHNGSGQNRSYTRAMRQADRLGAILERLSAGGSVSVTEIAADLGVSGATVRRDLHLLEGQRLLARTHGGAVAQGVLYELPLRYKGARHQDEKLRSAREAALRVADGEAIGLTGGTMTTEVARALVDRQCLTVVTNA